jgi:DNA ligase 1
MKKFETLYKRTSTGAVQIWYMMLDGNKHCATSGQRDGKHVTSAWTECAGKNIGKANETSPEEQALAEVLAKYEKQRKQGKYHDSVDDVDTAKFFSPMLAEKYKDRPLTEKDWEAGVAVQPKLDGMRCIATANGLQSRKGEKIVSAPHIMEQLQVVFDDYPHAVLDGELYNHDLKSEFEELMSIAKKTKPTEEHIIKSAEWLQFHIYDVFNPKNPDLVFKDRILNRTIVLGKCQGASIREVPTVFVGEHHSLDEAYEAWLADGYEGQMVRINNAPYENKRSKSLLKRKEFMDAEFPIVEIQCGKGNRADWAARVICSLPDGRTFAAGINGNAAYCKQLLIDKDKYVGSDAKIKFFRYTSDGIPLFGKCVLIYQGKRDD